MMALLTKTEKIAVFGGKCSQRSWYIPPTGGFYNVPLTGKLSLAYLNYSSGGVNIFCGGQSQKGLVKPGDISMCAANQYMVLQADNGGQGIYCVSG